MAQHDSLAKKNYLIPKIPLHKKLGDLPNNNHFITLQIDGQSPNLFYSNYITKTKKSVASNDITN